MQFTVVIPARYASTRLPGKPLSDIAGKPMVVRVCERALQSEATDVVVACDDARVQSVVADHGVTALMTSTSHRSGTDRLAEVVDLMELPEDAIVVNVQGDEPEIQPKVINQAAKLLADDAAAGMATLYTPITQYKEAVDPAVVKVVFDGSGQALYFSRAPVPFDREGLARGGKQLNFPLYRHIGIYAYRAEFLRLFSTLAPCDAEMAESLEQLRALYYGVSIRVAEACAVPPPGVDTPADLKRVRRDWGS